MDLESGVPTLVGPYRLLGRIGAGGMGIVYAGRDGEGRRAAVKDLHGALNTRELGVRTPKFSCGRESCTAKAEASLGIIFPGPKGARLLMAASFRESDYLGKKGKLISACKVERQVTAKQIRSLSIIMSCTTKEGLRRRV